MIIWPPRIVALRLKFKWNRRCRAKGKFHNRLCLGASYCVRWMVYDGCCWKHQDVYDRRAAKRLKPVWRVGRRFKRERSKRTTFFQHLVGRY